MNWGKEKELEIFQKLATKTTLELAWEYGYDKVYKDQRAMRNAVYALYNKVKNNPQEYGLAPDTVAIVVDAMKNRAMSRKTPTGVSVAEQAADKDIKMTILNIRDKTAQLIEKKLTKLENSKKELAQVSLKELGTLLGIAFDKGQIIKGEATEHIAHYAKIDGALTAEQALEMVLKGREKVQATKEAR